MTHAPDQIQQVLNLGSIGLSATEVSRLVDLPRETVRDWLAGRVPRARIGVSGGCDECGGPAHDFDGLPVEYVYLLGLYLGDGCLSLHPRGVYRLRVTLDRSYPAIIDECGSAMDRVLARKGSRLTGRKGCVEVYSYSKAWACLFPQHGPGKKHLRPIVLAPWQAALVDATPEPLIRGLIHSDGCRFMNTGTNWRSPRYVFSNHSQDILRIFTNACDQLGVRWTTCPNTVYVSRKADVARLDEFIGPKA